MPDVYRRAYLGGTVPGIFPDGQNLAAAGTLMVLMGMAWLHWPWIYFGAYVYGVGLWLLAVAKRRPA